MAKAGLESSSVLSHSFHHTNQPPLTEKRVAGQRTDESAATPAPSQQKQDLTQLFLPHLIPSKGSGNVFKLN